MNTEQNTETVKGPTGFETLMGGKDVTVTYQDGKTEAVRVRQLCIEDYPKLLAAMQDEATQAELYCGKEVGWAKQLTTECHDLVMEEGERINADFFGRWVQRRMRKLKLLGPELTDKLVGALANAQSKPTSPGLSARLPQRAD
jgi:hypothetical protein